MATLDLLPRKKFEITLDSGDVIKGQYGTWALKRFCDKKQCTLSGIASMLADPSISDVLEFILCAVEQSVREAKLPMTYNDVDAGMWCDELGGIGGADFVRLFNHSGDEQKKSETAEASNGENSSESQQVPE